MEALLSTVAEARARASRSGSSEARAHWRRVAEDALNDTDLVLRFRYRGCEPIDPRCQRHNGVWRLHNVGRVPCRPVPPSVAAVRRALERHGRITVARVAVLEADIAIQRSFLAGDRQWDRRMDDHSRAEQRLARILRYEDDV